MRNSILPILALLLFFVVSCNDPESSEAGTTANDTAAVSDSAAAAPADYFTYDPAMEPLTVGARFVKKITDTLGVKMYEFTVKPGDSASLHAHPDHLVYVLQGGTLLISMNGGAPQEMVLKTGVGFISGPLKDAGKNVGKTTIKLLVADIYRPRSK